MTTETRKLNQRERQTIQACRLHAEITRGNARWWERQKMERPAARAHELADQLEQKAAAIEAGAIVLVEQPAEEAA